MTDVPTIGEEDAKLVVLARSSRGRTGAPQGAAVRDLDGRTYAASTVTLPSLTLTALQAAVAAAVSSGVDGLEAAAVVGQGSGDDPGMSAVAHLGSGVPVVLADDSGEVRAVIAAGGRNG